MDPVTQNSPDSLIGSPADGPHRIAQLERELAQARQFEQQYRPVIDRTEDYAFILFDPDNRIVRWNRGATQIFGYAADEILGHSGSLLFVPEDRERGEPERELHEARRAGRADDERWHLRQDGSRFWGSGVLHAVAGEDGQPQGFLKIVRDLTPRKQLEAQLLESEQRFRLFVDNVTDYALIQVDLAGSISSWNPGAERTFGYAAEEIVGQPLERMFLPEDIAQNFPRQDLEHSLAEGRAEETRWMVRKDGQRFWARWTTTPIRNDGTLHGFAKVLRDETERQRLEQRDAFLVRLDDATRLLVTPEEITQIAARLLGEHLRVDRVVYCQFGPEGNSFEIAQEYRAPEGPSMIGRYTLSQFGRIAAERFRAQLPLVVDDLEADPETADSRKAYRQADIRSHLSVPLHKAGQLVAALGVHQRSPRSWQPDEIALVQLVANRCWESIERARIEASLRQQWHTFDTALSHTPDFIYIFDPEGRFTYANRPLLALWQKSLDEAVGRTFSELDYPPALAQKLQGQIQQVIQTGQPVRDTTPFTGPTGLAREYEYIFVPVLGADGRVDQVAGSTRDTTDRHQAEERMRASLAERDVLLQEIHHRVKNNLQVIIGLLELQSDRLTEPALLSAFQEAQNRVRAIAGIHELLYQSPDLARIDFGSYLQHLVGDLWAFYGSREQQIQVTTERQSLFLEITQAIPLGLILNELVTNCFKHAFPPGRPGEIRVELGQSEAGWGQLCVSDNGQGLPADFDHRQQESMGMMLVRILTKQLQGRVELDRKEGTEFRIVFPLAVTSEGEP